MRIAVDAMGSDTYPGPDVAGSVLAARESGDTILLVGDEARIRPELAGHDTSGLKLEIVHAAQAVTMADKPSEVGASKPESSMLIGMKLVADGQADAFVTAGNTGAALAIATLYTLRRIQNVKRPALTAILPLGEHRIILLDVGANADAKPEWMAQFALMGKIYAQHALGLENPRVALLSNGEEEGKGTQLIRDSAELLRALPLNYVGNVEPKEVLEGRAEVVVSDGFAGNIFIKTAEASMDALFHLIRDEIKTNVLYTLGGALARPAFRHIYHRLDPFEIGGAPLLGVNGVVIIGHGRSNARAIKNAIRQARMAVSGGTIEAIRSGLSTA